MSNAVPAAASRLNWRAIVAEVLDWTHNTLMMVGFFVVAAGTYLYLHPQAVLQLEKSAVRWVLERRAAVAALQEMGIAAAPPAPAPTAAPELNGRQKAIASWLSRRYNIAPQAMAQLVSSAWQVGQQEKLDPTLILAVMAVESSFNPYAQSAMGATGLMQVMTAVHQDKFAPYGGAVASIDPAANVRVGALVLKDAIARGGSVQAGLRMYVGASSETTEGGYATKVLAERARLQAVAAGQRISTSVALTAPPPQLSAA